MPTPRISLITATRNAAATLPALLTSVRQQTLAPYEHWVIDGASQDGTQAILAAHAAQLTGWLSEPDSGIAEAMNNGIAKASGDYVLILHADDRFTAPDSLAQAAAALNTQHAIFCFPVWQEQGKQRRLLIPHGWNWMINLKIGRCHQGIICQRILFAAIGSFDPHWRITMDYEWLLRAYRAGYRARVLHTPILATTGGDGLSAQRDWPSLQRRFREEQQIHQRHATPLLRPLYAVYWPLYWSYRWLRALGGAS